ncbi:hypothetical protein QQS21_009670 [Conoideocrella luteorostrata]|uniref:Alpha/beta hydrolase fold-3 domain-containing protein n=1 Tax=Conoideocrella luteorostrata TaxID=1105319 RepID=A0AAJ0CGH6_9HYPO|nr:hypothetical protein QQS21_009670 [Conoideocrella luteorostrata]
MGILVGIGQALHLWFRPFLVACFYPNIPWHIRWRMLLLQPTSLLTYSIESFPYLFSRPFEIEYLPVWPDRCVRALVFKTSGVAKGRTWRPLHIDIHGGAFLGGLPEGQATFDERIANETGAVVVSITYRLAPEHTFPAAIDDVDATIRWIQEHAQSRWGADPTLMTLSGASAGANLAIGSTAQSNCQPSSQVGPKALVLFDAAIDLRLAPSEKPRPQGFPKSEPLRVLYPLFDAYAAPARAKHMDDPRLSPALSRRENLPDHMLFIIAGMDIIVAEQLAFAHRINEEDRKQAGWTGPRVETVVVDGVPHGYLERE